MKGKVLITRPQEEAKVIAELVRQKGYEVVSEPFLKVVFEDIALPDLSAYAALVFTSVNGVRAFCRISKDRNLPVFTVGQNTAEAVREKGFKTIQSADGDGAALAALLSKNPSDKPYLYGRGAHVTRDLSAEVEGVRIEEITLYHTEKIDETSEVGREVLAQGGVSHVLFFSKRTAEAFVDYIRTQELDGVLERTKALCLGAPMVQCLSVLPWEKVIVADRPNRDGIMALLD